MKRLFALVICSLLFAIPAFGADYTTTKAVLMDWTLLDDTGATPYLESTALVTDTWIGCTLYIDVAHTDTDTGTTGTKLKVWSKSGTTDEDWHEYMELSMSTGTAANEGNVTASAADNCTLNMASTTNFEVSGDVYFVEDAGTLANSCLVVNGDFSNDAYVTTIDNRVNAYDAADSAWDIVNQWPVRLGPGFTYKVTFHNTDTAANYACRIHYVAETDIE